MAKPAMLAAVMFAALVFAACSESDGSADAVPTQQATVTSEASLSPTASAAEPTSTIPAEPTATPAGGAPAPPDETLADALLSLSDMPPGWSPSTSDDGDDDLPFCPDSDPPELTIIAAGQAETVYRQSELGPFFFQAAFRFTGDQAQQAMATFSAGIAECDEWTVTDDATGSELRYSIEPLSFDHYGEETFAFRLLMHDVPLLGSVQADYAVVRYGTSLVILGYASFGDGANTAEFPALADLADEKARDRLSR